MAALRHPSVSTLLSSLLALYSHPVSCAPHVYGRITARACAQSKVARSASAKRLALDGAPEARATLRRPAHERASLTSPCYPYWLAPSARTRAFFPAKDRNEADHGMLGTANNEANAWALYKKAAAHGDAAGP